QRMIRLGLDGPLIHQQAVFGFEPIRLERPGEDLPEDLGVGLPSSNVARVDRRCQRLDAAVVAASSFTGFLLAAVALLFAVGLLVALILLFGARRGALGRLLLIGLLVVAAGLLVAAPGLDLRLVLVTLEVHARALGRADGGPATAHHRVGGLIG